MALDLYGNDNPRFRKAVIRERLEAIKVERLSLLAERERLDQAIASIRDSKKQASGRERNGAAGAAA